MTESSTDPSRRQFFRRFAGEVLTGAAQVVAVVEDLRERSAAEAAVLLADGSSPVVGEPGVDPAPTGFRTPFRFESDERTDSVLEAVQEAGDVWMSGTTRVPSGPSTWSILRRRYEM